MSEATETAAPAWELSKENVQPVKRGRDVRALNRALQARPAKDALDDERR